MKLSTLSKRISVSSRGLSFRTIGIGIGRGEYLLAKSLIPTTVRLTGTGLVLGGGTKSSITLPCWFGGAIVRSCCGTSKS